MMEKRYIKSLVLLLMVWAVSSCEDFLDINDDPSAATEASIDQLFTSSQLGIGAVLGGQHIDGSGSLNEDPAIFVQHYYNLDESRFDIAGSDYDANWRDLYSEPLQDMEIVITEGTDQEFWRHVGIAQIQKAFIFNILVDLFGEVPYFNAFQGQDNLNPEFDAGADVYDALFDLINEGITNLQKQAPTPLQDLFYGGNANAWIRVANTLKLKMYNQIRLVDESRATTEITALVNTGNLIASTDQDFQFQYGSSNASPLYHQHPLYIENYHSDVTHYPSAYLIYTMNGTNDPRVPYYWFRQFLDDPTGTDVPCDAIDCSPYGNNGYFGRGYFSRVQGDDSGIPNDIQIRTIFGVYPAGGLYDIVEKDDDGEPIALRSVNIDSNTGEGIQPFLTYFLSLFIQAEAALTLGTPGDPRALLEQAIRAQIAKVVNFGQERDANALGFSDPALDDLTGDPAGMTVQEKTDNYVNARLVQYDNATTDEERLEVIMVEKHKATFGMGWEAYNDYRRTGYPEFFNMQAKDGSLVTYPDNAREAAFSPQGAYPRRLLYSNRELNTNGSLGNQTTKDTPVFWDNN